jgi:hypothetical protein
MLQRQIIFWLSAPKHKITAKRFPTQPQGWIIALALLAGATACAKKPYQIARAHASSAESAYCTNNIREAEKAMIAYLNTITEDESKRRGGIDYYMARATTHERLFLIYRKQHDTNKVESEFRQSLEWLDRYKKRVGIPPTTNLTHEAFAALLERSERGLEVRWKKE